MEKSKLLRKVKSQQLAEMCSNCGGGSDCSCGSCSMCNCGSCNVSSNSKNEWY